MTEGRVRKEGQDGQEEVCDAKNPAYGYQDHCYRLVHLPEVYNDTHEEQEDGGVEESREEGDERVNI